MNIAYTGGGTLGSVTPLLALAEKEEAEKKIWIGTRTGPEKPIIEKAGIPFFGVPEYKLRRYADIQTVTQLPNFFTAVRNSLQLLREHKISFVYTAGGFTGVPVCYAARRLGIPYAILQLDVKAGLSNKILQRKARYIFTAFEHHTSLAPNDRTLWTGVPVSIQFESKERKQGVKATMLFLGGGTGSEWINRFVQEHLDALLSIGRVVHVYSSKTRLPLPIKKREGYEVYESLSREQMSNQMKQSACVISRAGMGTIAECSASRTPALLIPMPRSHQEINARYLQKNGACILAEQNEGADTILQRISSLLKDGILQQELASKMNLVLPTDHAAETIISQTHHAEK